MALSLDRKKRLTALFKDEVADHLRKLSNLLLDVEREMTPDEQKIVIEDIFRSFHTIKGSAKVLNVAVIQAVAHTLEDIFSEIRRGKRPIDEAVIDVSLGSLDVIMSCLENDLEMAEDEPSVVHILARLRVVKESPSAGQASNGSGGIVIGRPEDESSGMGASRARSTGQPMNQGAQPGHAPQPAAFPGQQAGHAPQPAAFPGQQAGHAPQPAAFPGQQAGHAPQPAAFPGQQAGHAPQPAAFGSSPEQVASPFQAPASTSATSPTGAVPGDPWAPGPVSPPLPPVSGSSAAAQGAPDQSGGMTFYPSNLSAEANPLMANPDFTSASATDGFAPPVVSPSPASRTDSVSPPVDSTPMSAERASSASSGLDQTPVERQTRRGSPRVRASDRTVPRGSYETIRVTTEKLDSLMNKVGELVISKSKANQRLVDIRQLTTFVSEAMGSCKLMRSVLPTLSSHAGDVQSVTTKNTELEEVLKNLERKVTILEREFSADVSRMEINSRDLEDDIRSLRLLPISDLVDPFFRMVRDLAKDLDKQAYLKIEGGETEVDKKVLEALRDPLLHLLRNSLDHGLESAEERKAAGKPGRGTIKIATFQKGMSIQMEVSDDGRGIDPEKIRRAVISKGFLPQERAEALSNEQLYSILFEPGFTTTDKVTETSGRGVGLDVVRENLSSFNGSIEIQSVPGRGTTFALSLPLTLITTQALLVQCGKQILAIPSMAIEKTLEICVADVQKVDTRHVVMLEGQPLVYLSLAQALSLPSLRIPSEGNTHVVILSDGTRRVALQVDQIKGEQEVVHKGLGANFIRVRNVAGATILGTGQVVIMLNPHDLVRTALGIAKADLHFEPARGRKARVLLVEDSFATRAYEQEILEAAGFEVITAPDGVAALDVLAVESVDGVVTDIEMPRLDGLRLTRRIKSDAHTADIPVVIVSSLSTDDAKQKGLEVGADAYVVKGEFEKDSFLTMLRDLVSVNH